MEIITTNNPIELGKLAGKAAADLIINTIAQNGQANIILATGASQFETLNQLISDKRIDWSKVVMFHLDEYIGLPVTAAASFRKYLKERFLSKVPALKEVYLIDGEADPEAECKRLSGLINQYHIDVALVGIGENGHLAFNDPPADFNTEKPYIIVELNELCRKQQLTEGWFDTLDAVPTKAISMSIHQILKSKYIICSVPDSRKALAVKNCLENSIDEKYPASILQKHANCNYYFDKTSVSMLSQKTLAKIKNKEFSLTGE
ncbi:MAG TPA: glucosamine-6-phosphate deaminase [Hanamia sp.]